MKLFLFMIKFNQAYQMVLIYSGNDKVDLAVFIPSLLTWNLCFGSVEPISAFNQLIKKCNQLISKIEERLDVNCKTSK